MRWIPPICAAFVFFHLCLLPNDYFKVIAHKSDFRGSAANRCLQFLPVELTMLRNVPNSQNFIHQHTHTNPLNSWIIDGYCWVATVRYVPLICTVYTARPLLSLSTFAMASLGQLTRIYNAHRLQKRHTTDSQHNMCDVHFDRLRDAEQWQKTCRPAPYYSSVWILRI